MDPRLVWLSDNFRLSDFLGNHSVYSSGLKNNVEFSDGDIRLRNARQLCEKALEPLLEMAGPVSIAYGCISESFSRATVRYQDPDLPSHHRWDLGAAADVVAHRWVQGLPHEPDLLQLFANGETSTSPALLAHAIDQKGVPYSRLISYSESPYLCIAVAERELVFNRPRKAFYENRYEGVRGAKPRYIQQASETARARVRNELQEVGLTHGWEGQGYPSYHGGGRRQYQHMRVSKYTMVLDWLFNLKSISDGIRNIPALTSEEVQDSFAAAGLTFDWVVDNVEGLPRLSVLSGYTCRSHPDYTAERDWRLRTISVEIGANLDSVELAERVAARIPQEISVEPTPLGAQLTIPVLDVLDGLLG